MNLTPHFTLQELTTTKTGKANTPNTGEVAKLRALCSAVLEPWREIVGPLRVNSGFRSEAVNNAVGGSSTSQHRYGEAADVTPLGWSRARSWRALLDLMAAGLPVDQAIIYESTSHVHLSHTARHNARREALVKTSSGQYVEWSKYLQWPDRDRGITDGF